MQWLTLVIPAIWEVEIRKIVGEKVSEVPAQQINRV
jgi:hypothetical protein